MMQQVTLVGDRPSLGPSMTCECVLWVPLNMVMGVLRVLLGASRRCLGCLMGRH